MYVFNSRAIAARAFTRLTPIASVFD